MTSGPGGYSITPLAKKLGVKAGGRVLTREAPSGWGIEALPPGATCEELRADTRANEARDVVVAFFRRRKELEGAIPRLSESIFPAGALWIAWPRRAAGHESDIREQDIRDLALPLGVVDVKVAALGEDWSGLRLVWRTDRRTS